MRIAGLAGLLLLVSPLAGWADDSLFQELGGRDKISAFVADLDERIAKDPRIAHFFTETDMPRFHDRLTDMICHLAGEQRHYRGANMKNAHEGFGIADADFTAMVENLEAAMDDNQVPWSAQARLLAIFAPMRHDIVEK